MMKTSPITQIKGGHNRQWETQIREYSTLFLKTTIPCSCTFLEAQTEVEELRKEIEELREKVQEAEKV